MDAFLRKGFGFVLLFFAGNNVMYSQINLSKFEIGLTGGTCVYQGDLTPSPVGSYRTLRPAVNIFVNRILNPFFSLRTSIFYGGLSGSDAAYNKPAWRQQRNFNFTSHALELSELLVWNAWSTDRKFTPYVFGGIGLSFLNAKRDWSHFNGEFFSSENIEAGLAEDIAHATPGLIPVVPVGVGFQYSVTNNLSAIGETAYRFTRTDYLDGFSKAANPNLNDHYQSHTIGLLYKFGKRSTLNCPTIIR